MSIPSDGKNNFFSHGLYKKSYADGDFYIGWHNEGNKDGLYR